jgi:hypothetical protein
MVAVPAGIGGRTRRHVIPNIVNQIKGEWFSYINFFYVYITCKHPYLSNYITKNT